MLDGLGEYGEGRRIADKRGIITGGFAGGQVVELVGDMFDLQDIFIWHARGDDGIRRADRESHVVPEWFVIREALCAAQVEVGPQITFDWSLPRISEEDTALQSMSVRRGNHCQRDGSLNSRIRLGGERSAEPHRAWGAGFNYLVG